MLEEEEEEEEAQIAQLEEEEEEVSAVSLALQSHQDPLFQSQLALEAQVAPSRVLLEAEAVIQSLERSQVSVEEEVEARLQRQLRFLEALEAESFTA